jgi:glycosyltransferase involved in cell wall biosynthesis
MNDNESDGENSVLVISEHTNPDKIRRHVGPLSAITEQTVMVCLTPNRNVEIGYIKVPSFGSRLLGIALLFPMALREAIKEDYDLIVSFSLFPYGLYAIALGSVTRTPTHLGILGADLDVHAHASYRWLPRAAFRRFDSISVLGSEHRSQLAKYGVSTEDIFILTNAIDTDVYSPAITGDQSTFNFVWSGRLSREKNPLLFVEAIHELQKRGHEVTAVILGKGELESRLEETIEKFGLSHIITHPGWVEEPAEYYAKSQIFVLTSNREALGLSLIESMAMGLACIAPSVGNIPDIAENGENAILVEENDPIAFADAMEQLITDKDLRDLLGANAIPVGRSFSYENAQNDWREIVAHTVD